jgi:RNA polymerase sigma-70 factor (ECF subfamily)
VNDQHDPGQLAAYAVGLLDGEDVRATAAHVAGCQRCQRELTELREVDGALRRMPSELFLGGPPQGGELQGGEPVLQRTLRQVRAQSGTHRRRRRLALVAAAVVALAGVGTAGVALGRVTAGRTITAEPAEAGSRLLTGFNQSTGARMSVTVTPDAGWVRVKATVVGLSVGERCMLVVVDRRGNPSVAGSWLVDSTSEKYSIDSCGISWAASW